MSTSLFDLTGKIALVTGATHGLGMAMARGIGRAGAKVIINGNSSQQKIDNAVSEFIQEGIDAYGYRFDVTDEKSVIKGMVERKSGKIINICSMMSELGRNTVGAYAAAKAD